MSFTDCPLIAHVTAPSFGHAASIAEDTQNNKECFFKGVRA